MLLDKALSTLVNLVLLAGLPVSFYYLYHRIRHRRTLSEVLRRAGLQLGAPRYIWYCVAVSLGLITALTLWAPPLEPFIREGSAQQSFMGLGLGSTAIAGALMYGVIQTGFSEELLFRGLIAGSLSRRMSPLWANVTQAAIFLIPHLLLLFVMPEMWGLLIFVFLLALFAGWARIKSESIVGPWLLHASVNVTMALSIAARTVA